MSKFTTLYSFYWWNLSSGNEERGKFMHSIRLDDFLTEVADAVSTIVIHPLPALLVHKEKIW